MESVGADLRSIGDVLSPFGEFMRVRITSDIRDRVAGEIRVTRDITNNAGVMHGGAIMALADLMGGMATLLNLPKTKRTTTIESKTNFLRGIAAGETARAVCVPLHRGRTTMVWQTIISGDDGKTAAIVTQTQLVISRAGV